MSLKFNVGSIEKGIRSCDDKTSFQESALVILGECFETLEVEITVKGLPSSGKGEATMSLNYFEQYEPHITFSEFYARARLFAMKYCERLDLSEGAA